MLLRTLTLLAFTALAGSIAGCATAGSVPVGSAPPEITLDSGMAMVYIIREHAEPMAWPATVHLDEMRVAALGQKSYTRVHVAAGEHRIRVTWNPMAGQKSYASPFRIIAGETYYLMLGGISRYTGPNELTLGSGLTMVDAREGADAIARCRAFTPPALQRYPVPPAATAQPSLPGPAYPPG